MILSDMSEITVNLSKDALAVADVPRDQNAFATQHAEM
jgi:hypothetical protein